MDTTTIIVLGLAGVALAGAAGYYTARSANPASKLPRRPALPPIQTNPRALPELFTTSPSVSRPHTEMRSPQASWEAFISS